MTKTILDKIFRFPVKGFPSQQLSATTLQVGIGIPLDRRFAITKGTVDTGEWMRARSFYINSTTDGMSKFEFSLDGDIIRLRNVEGMELTIPLDDPTGIAAANERIIQFMQPVGVQDDLPPPLLVDRSGKQSNWDYADTPISIINLESVKAVSEVLGYDLDPLRFRGNLVVSGIPAWEEFSWMGKRLKVGDAEIEVHRPIDRCPTPGVNPETGERDIEVTPGIQEHFGHIHCGMYAKVVKEGDVAEGSRVEVIADATMHWEEAATDYASDYALWPRAVEISAYEIGDTLTRLSLESATPWPLPEAITGQRLRLHLGADQWTTQYIASNSGTQFHLEVEDSKTDDPVTGLLRNGLSQGRKILVTGPFGKVRA